MKKLYYLIVLTLILGLVLTGCLLSNVGQVPATEQSEPTILTRGIDIYVATTGSDTNGDGSFGSPWATISHAISQAAPTGDTINVANGDYTITSKILVDKGVTITGNIANPENVVVQYDPVANSLIFDMRASNATIQGIKTTGGKSGFWFDQSGVTGCTISHCIVDTVNEYGIYMKNGGSGHTIEYTTISNTGQIYVGAPAFLIENSLNVTLNGNILSSISDKGIFVRVCAASNTGERVEVTNNTLSGCNYPCVQVYKSPYTIVDGNTISSTNDKGINIIGPNANSAAERVELTNNIISGCPWGAILVTHDRYTYIHGNTVGPTGDKGITIGNGENVGSSTERIMVEGNTVSCTKWPGIQVAWDIDYTYIHNNTVTGCNYYGGDGTGDWDYASIYVAEDCGNTIVDSNDVSDGINGIQIWSDNCTVTNNTIYDMGLSYEDTKLTADGIYYNSGIIIGSNWLTSNFKPTGTTITGNNIHDNYWGLYVRDYATLSPSDPSVLSVTATCNWWGSSDGPGGVGPGTGNNVSANVVFCPWFDSVCPGGNCNGGAPVIDEPITIVPAVTAISEEICLTANFTDPMGGTHTATIDWGDVSTITVGVVDEDAGTVAGCYTYTNAGVYTVTLTIIDNYNLIDTADFRYAVVYDSSEGFVTGGGWINSPTGAYTADPSLTGKANFGFVSKYKKGATVPTGKTEFQFKAGDLNFHSDSYEWLVIAHHKAMYKGTGTINGTGNYGFMLSATDGQIIGGGGVDKFRIKIWERANDDNIIYDNQMGDGDDADPTTEIGGGQIVIHKRK